MLPLQELLWKHLLKVHLRHMFARRHAACGAIGHSSFLWLDFQCYIKHAAALHPLHFLLHTSPGPFTYPFHFTSRLLLLKGTGQTWGAHHLVRQKLISRHLETQSQLAWRSGWAGKFSRETILSVSHQHRSVLFLWQASNSHNGVWRSPENNRKQPTYISCWKSDATWHKISLYNGN